MNLRWKVSFSASCLHAAACLHGKLPVADPKLAAVLEPAVGEFVREIGMGGLSPERLLPQLTGLAAEYENNRQLVEICLSRFYGRGFVSSSFVERLAGQIADLEAALRRYHPQIAEELAVRILPLRQQWESRGPGMLAQLAALTEKSFVADAAEVVLVAPIAGGHGQAHQNLNRVTFEAVLTNPHEDLPETIRLAWLLAQMNIDLPKYSEPIAPGRLPQIATLATLPPALAAAEAVELLRFDEASLAQALQRWYCNSADCTDLAARLQNWWSAFRSGAADWHIALAALGELLED